MIPIEFKDQVARKYGYRDWEQMSAMVYNPMKYLEEASLLYCNSKWDEAVDNQRIILNRLFDDAGGTLSSYYTMKELKRPEFKP